jgi:hypothetical protein
VGDEDDRGRAVGERVLDVGEERGAGGRVEAGGGFVEQQRVGLAGEGSREADALGLAAQYDSAVHPSLLYHGRICSNCDAATTGRGVRAWRHGRDGGRRLP